jgi:hypothetical protein
MAGVRCVTIPVFVGALGDIFYKEAKIGVFSTIHIVEVNEFSEKSKKLIRKSMDIQLKNVVINVKYLNLFAWGKNAKGKMTFGGTNAKFNFNASGKWQDGSSQKHCCVKISNIEFNLSEEEEKPEYWDENLKERCIKLMQLSGKCGFFGGSIELFTDNHERTG